MGVSTTHKAVIKAAFEAVVYWMPTVWVIKLPQIKNPSVMPLDKVRRLRDLDLPAAKGVSMTNAMRNRSPTRYSGGSTDTKVFSTGKVPPQISVTNTKSKSALRGLILPTP
jgi:hypothetical protein